MSYRIQLWTWKGSSASTSQGKGLRLRACETQELAPGPGAQPEDEEGEANQEGPRRPAVGGHAHCDEPQQQERQGWRQQDVAQPRGLPQPKFPNPDACVTAPMVCHVNQVFSQATDCVMVDTDRWLEQHPVPFGANPPLEGGVRGIGPREERAVHLPCLLFDR